MAWLIVGLDVPAPAEGTWQKRRKQMQKKPLSVQKITAKGFSPYGEVVEIEGKTALADTPVFKYFNDISVGELSGGSIGFGMVVTKPGALEAPMLERHLRTTETLMPLDEDVILVVAQPTTGGWPNTDNAAAFLVPCGTGVTLKKGTWHYVPLIRGKKEARTLVVFRQGTPAEDLEVKQLGEKDILLTVAD
jgi:ureidoglycolate lyase